MTVKELINKLKNYPQDMNVLIEHDFWLFKPDEFRVCKIALDETTGNFTDIELIEEYYSQEEIKQCLVIH